jgi:hypothetical protein
MSLRAKGALPFKEHKEPFYRFRGKCLIRYAQPTLFRVGFASESYAVWRGDEIEGEGSGPVATPPGHYEKSWGFTCEGGQHHSARR